MPLIFHETFENVAAMDAGSDWLFEKNNAINVGNPREGVNCIRFTPDLDNTIYPAPNRERSEIAISAPLNYDWFTEYWVGCAIKIVTPVNGFNSVMQHHARPNNNDFANRSASTNGFTLRSIGPDNLTILTSTNVNKIDGTEKSAFSDQVYKSVDIVNGEWIDVVLHFNYSDTNTGFFEVWINGVKEVNIHNQSTVYRLDGGLLSDGSNPLRKDERDYQKIGIYGGWSTIGEGVGEVHYDSFRIWEGIGKYTDVSPLGLSPYIQNKSTGILTKR